MTKKFLQFSQGVTGPQGDQGPPGDIGQTGTPGPQGDPGEKGQTGETVSIKTVISIETKDQIESFEQLKHRHKQQGDPVRHQFFCQGTFQTKGATYECLSVFACIVLAHVHALHATFKDFFPFRKLHFGGRQSNVSMTIMASRVSRTTISLSILRGSELLFHLNLTLR